MNQISKKIKYVLLLIAFLNINLFALNIQNTQIKKIDNNLKIITSKKNTLLYQSKNKTYKTHLKKLLKISNSFRKNKKETKYYLYVYDNLNMSKIKNLYKIFFPKNKIFLQGAYAVVSGENYLTKTHPTIYKRIYTLGVLDLVKSSLSFNIYHSNKDLNKALKNKDATFEYLILEKDKNKNIYRVREIMCKNIILNNKKMIKKMTKLSKDNFITLVNEKKLSYKDLNKTAIFCKKNIYTVKNKKDIENINSNYLKKVKVVNEQGKEIKKN